MSRNIVLIVILTSCLLMSSHALADGGVLTLAEGVRLVTRDSRMVKIGQYDETIAESNVSLARSRLMPEVKASAGHTWFAEQPGAIFGATSVPLAERNFYFYSISAEQTLYDFGATTSGIEASRMLLQAQHSDLSRTKNFAALQFVRSYCDLLEAGKMQRVALNEVERLQSHLKKARSLYEEGVITKNDLLQAEVRISDARQRLLTAQLSTRLAAARVNNLLARPLAEEISPVEIAYAAYPPVPGSREEILEMAERQRPEVLFLDAVVKSVDAESSVKRAEYFPRIFLKGGYDYTENRYQVHEGNWALTAGMRVNLFSGGSTKAGLDALAGKKKRVLEERAKMLDDIRLEADAAILDLRTSEERAEVARGAVAQAEENLRINRAKYEEGEGTATDVLDAVLLLTIAETNSYRAGYDVARARAWVYYSTGRDLTEVYR